MANEIQVIQQIRLRIGDNLEPYLLADEEIAFYLYKDVDIDAGEEPDVDKTVQLLTPIVLRNMATRFAREREGNVEVYGGEKTRNAIDAMKYLRDSGLDTSTRAFAAPIIPNDGTGSRFTIGQFSETGGNDDDDEYFDALDLYP